MKLVEIAGNLIDPGKVSYVGPVIRHEIVNSAHQFAVIVDGETVVWVAKGEALVLAARQSLVAAIESAQPEMTELEATGCCFHWAKHPQDGGAVLLEHCAALERETGNCNPFIHREPDDQIPLSCPFDCKDEIPETVVCRLCVATGAREGRIPQWLPTS